MRCLEVSINGDVKSTAGVAGAESIEARVSTYPRTDESHVVVTGSVDVAGQPNAEAAWVSMPLGVGDVVAIRLVEEVAPTSPTLGRYGPIGGATDNLSIFCAFCGKSNDQVEGSMLASTNALICRACVKALHRVVVNEGFT